MSTKEFPKEAITKQIKKICLSSELVNKTILCSLLKFLVTETLAGREERLKGYTIGTEALGKDEDFDPDKDPLVRIHAGRLRRALRLYYLETGKNDAIRIEIPKGQYAPDFIANDNTTVKENDFRIKDNKPAIEPSVAVIPFKNISGDPDKDYFGVGFAEELSIELTRFEDLTVYESVPFSANQISGVDIHSYLKKKGIRFIVEGSIRIAVKNIKVLVRLIDNKKGKQIWAEKYLRELSGNDLNEILENIIREISGVLGSEYGIILQRLSHEIVKQKPKNISTFHAISRFYCFETTQSPEAFIAAFDSLEQAIANEPTSGIAHAMLAALYGNKYMLDLPNAEQALIKTNELSEKAIELEPNSSLARVIYTWKHFLNNDKRRFIQETEFCLSKNPHPSLRLGTIGFYLALYGEWEKGKVILDKVMQSIISFPLYYFGATMLYYYRKKEYKKALTEALQYEIPALFWGPMLRIAVMGQLNMVTEIKPNIEHLLLLKPDFEKNARYLIRLFIKEEELTNHVIEGLQKAGMNV